MALIDRDRRGACWAVDTGEPTGLGPGMSGALGGLVMTFEGLTAGFVDSCL